MIDFANHILTEVSIISLYLSHHPAGGGGFVLGMMLGGPIGAVIGGLAATATTGVALESLDEHTRLKQLEEEKTRYFACR